MTLTEAANAVILWLSRKDIAFALASARAIDETHFEIAIRQVFPENRTLNFRMEPEEQEECWKVVEVAATP